MTDTTIHPKPRIPATCYRVHVFVGGWWATLDARWHLDDWEGAKTTASTLLSQGFEAVANSDAQY